MNQDEVTIIEPDQASVILTQKLDELESEGWVMLVRTDYMARLTRGRHNLDVQVDLLGQIEIRQTALSASQESGQIVGIMLVLALLLLAITLASILNLFDLISQIF